MHLLFFEFPSAIPSKRGEDAISLPGSLEFIIISASSEAELSIKPKVHFMFWKNVCKFAYFFKFKA